jgi:hypothetical protein
MFDITNTFSNPETDAELADAMEAFVDHVAEEIIAAWQAARANPECGNPSIVAMFSLIEDRAMEIRDEKIDALLQR